MMLRSATLMLAGGLVLAGCGPDFLGGGSYGWFGGRGGAPSVSTRTVQLRWREEITDPHAGGLDFSGAYVPVERAAPALDPSRDRIYVGTGGGRLLAMTAHGSRIYAYPAGAGIYAQPTLDAVRDELYFATEDGVVHKIAASDGELAWRAEISGAVSQPMVLTEDALYLVTDDDAVVALDRETGDALWRYRREPGEGFYVSRHAGLTLADGRLLTAFTNGVIVSLTPSDGSLQWERDTSVELEPGPDGTPRFADVDTTPLVVDDLVYVASFAGGMYALEIESGTVRWRDEELTGVTGITPASDRILILSSGDLGVLAIDRVDREVLWRKTIPRGAPTEAVVAQDRVLFGESQGGFITVALQNGRELGRVETGHGFTAPPAVAAGRAFVVSNGGTLFAFAL